MALNRIRGHVGMRFNRTHFFLNSGECRDILGARPLGSTAKPKSSYSAYPIALCGSLPRCYHSLFATKRINEWKTMQRQQPREEGIMSVEKETRDPFLDVLPGARWRGRLSQIRLRPDECASNSRQRFGRYHLRRASGRHD